MKEDFDGSATHEFEMNDQRMTKQALQWKVPVFKRGQGRPKANWKSRSGGQRHTKGGTHVEEAEAVSADGAG